MRAEDKELEGPELARESELEVVEEVERVHEEELPMFATEEVADTGLAHESRLLDAVALILAGEQVNVSLLYLPRRETEALEFLQTAATGHDVHLGQFVYAEDRLPMLEQALAVLQQNLTHGDPARVAELHARFDVMSSHLGGLRDRLRELEDAQDDLETPTRAHGKRDGDETDETDETDDQTDDQSESETESEKPKRKRGFLAKAISAVRSSPAKHPKAGGGARDDESARPSTLSGDDRPEPARPPSTLSGDDRPEPARPPSTLSGDDRPEPPRTASTLSGDDRPEPPRAASTLSGDDRPEPPRPPSTLYEQKTGERG